MAQPIPLQLPPRDPHAELLARVPQYRYLLAADDELDDNVARSCTWEDDEQRSRLCHVYQEREASVDASRAACETDNARRFATSEAETR